MALESDAIDHRGVNAIGDGVASLNRFPGIELRGAELRFFVGMPANARGIENNLGAAQSGEARAFGIPLIPANLHAHARVFRVEIWKAEIAGGEIKFFVIQRVIRNVHLAVLPEERSVSVQNSDTVVVNARSAALENRNDQRNFLCFRDLRQFFGGGSGYGLSEIEKLRVFGAAKIFAVKQLVE